MPDIVLKDRDGNPQTYEGINAINVLREDGTEQMMIAGESEEITVDLNFADGNMEILPDEGKLITKVSVPKPETLIPVNIADGVDIAGIVGTLAKGNSVKFAGGTKKDGGSNTLTHNLGVVPDFVILFLPNATVSNYKDYVLVYMSDVLQDATGLQQSGFSVGTSSSKAFRMSTIIPTCTTTEIKLPGTLAYPATYYWIAIGGLA